MDFAWLESWRIRTGGYEAGDDVRAYEHDEANVQMEESLESFTWEDFDYIHDYVRYIAK